MLCLHKHIVLKVGNARLARDSWRDSVESLVVIISSLCSCQKILNSHEGVRVMAIVLCSCQKILNSHEGVRVMAIVYDT